MIEKELFLETLRAQGFCVAKQVVSPAAIATLLPALQAALKAEDEYHGCTEYPTYGSVLNLATQGGELFNLLENEDLLAPFDWVIGNGSIVYSYSSACVPPQSKIHTARIHTDSARGTTDHSLLLGALLMVSDFTQDNGAPLYLGGSHNTVDKPTDEYFFANATKLTGTAGDVIYFDPLVWHSGAQNKTNEWRHAITLGFCKPWIKQRFDIPRSVEQAGLDKNLSETLLQRLGFKNRVPVTYNDYYKK